MGKFWSIIFLLVPILGVFGFVYGLWFTKEVIWLPEDLSKEGHIIDDLFYFILWLTGIVFIVTEGALAWYLWKYDSKTNKDPVKYTHGSHSLEVIWTILPAATLLFIAIYQINAWAERKMYNKMPEGEPMVEVVGRQFEWRIRYPGPDGKLYTPDDLHTVNELHVPVNEKVLVRVRSRDVLHSFFLPQMRIKQDVVPGLQQHIWFTPTKIGKTDIVCAELCGWGHYKMAGDLVVQSKEDYNKWIQELAQKQKQSMPDPKTSETSEDE